MFEHMVILEQLGNTPLLSAQTLLVQTLSVRPLLGQVGVPADPSTAEQAALVFSGPQFLVALVSGLLLAFAMQLLLTNLSVALGISFIGKSSGHHDDHSDDHSSGSIGSTIRKIGFGVGLWTLISVSVSLFIACYLAVQLSLLHTAVGLGAIVGLVIWAAYFTLLVWFSSSTVGSLIGSVVNTATSGFQAIVGTAAAALGGKAVNDQIVSTAEAAAAAVRREFTVDVNPTRVRDTIEDYIDKIRPAQLDFSNIRREFESILSDPEVRSMVGPEGLNVDRQKFVDLVSSRTDLSKMEVDRIAEQLERVWKQTLGQQQKPDQMTQLLEYLRSTQEGQLNTQEVSSKLDQLVAEMKNTRSPQGDQQSSSRWQTIQSNVMPLIGLVMGRSDLSP
jgi:hypothetical protein